MSAGWKARPRLPSPDGLGREVGVLRAGARCGRCRSFAQSPEAVDAGADPDSPRRFIEFDTRLDADVARITEDVLRDFWGRDSASDEIKARFVAPINDALARVFGNGSATTLRLDADDPCARTDSPPTSASGRGQSETSTTTCSAAAKRRCSTSFSTCSSAASTSRTPSTSSTSSTCICTRGSSTRSSGRSSSTGFRTARRSGRPATRSASSSTPATQRTPPSSTSTISTSTARRCWRRRRSPPTIFDIAVPRDSALKVFPNKTLVVCENQDALLYNAIELPGLIFVGATRQERRRAADQSERRIPRPDRPGLPRCERNRGAAPRAAEPLRARVLLD